ncbi:hypothetical protein Mapa_005618 [Marchantia paleacea]|nr:hypothetical protein Mapa_005618 [Marchantia paleacea]
MVRAKKDDGGASAEEQLLALESKRLKELAVSRGLLARAKANAPAPLVPTKTIRKCNGKDIVKKGNRKTKYLFAFPGLVAPVSGGKFGDLTHLDSRNPILYIDFPHGRLKLFGTIVYPKNKYLTMHFVPGRGDIVCEDCFESLVVFPESWWIGTKEENPEELCLPLPSDLQQVKHADFDFNAGAGRVDEASTTRVVKAASTKNDPNSPVLQFPVDNLDELGSPTATANEKPLSVRQSARNSGKKTRYALSSSDNSEEGSEDASESSDYNWSTRDHGAKKTNVAEEVVETLFESTSAEQLSAAKAPRAVLKQGTLTGYLSKKTEVVHITDSPDLSQKRRQGQKKTAEVTKKRRQSITEISSDSNEEDFSTPTDDSD